MNETLVNKIAEYHKDRSAKQENEKVWSEHKEFLRLYPFRKRPERIDRLTAQAVYNPNQRDRTYFFYWIEHRLKAFAHLGIGSARVWENARNNLSKLRELLRTSVDDSKTLAEKLDAHWEDIPRFGGDRQIAKKIIFCYYPGIVLPALKTEDREFFCEQLGLRYREKAYQKYGKDYDTLSVGQKFELSNDLLLAFKKEYREFQGWDNAYFSRFLYTYLTPDSRTLEQIPRREAKPFSAYGLIAEPSYEQEVVFLFSKFHVELGFPFIVKIQEAFPDAEAMNRQRELKKIEFEVRASDFVSHGHNPAGCDYIVCWEDDLTDEKKTAKRLPKVIALKEELEKS
jgi:hypothetical protein